MGADAVVTGTKIEGTCTLHMIPSGSGTAPKGPAAFSAPISQKTIASVLIGGKPAAVVDSFGFNTKIDTHAGIVDAPYASGPPAQKGTIRSGSPTVLFKGQAAATSASLATCCQQTDAATGFKDTVPSVQIG